MKIATRLGVFAASALMAIALSTPVFAVSANAQQNGVQSQSQTAQPTPTPTDKKQAIQARLTETKMKACRNREKAINNIMARIVDRGQKQINLFSTIAEKTEAFYAKKGKTLNNYDALVADVNAKKTAAQSALDDMKNNPVKFACDGSDPKGAANAFKESLKAEIASLKAYKTSVRNLIVGVKSVQGTTSSASPTPSVSPTPTEGVQNAQ